MLFRHCVILRTSHLTKIVIFVTEKIKDVAENIFFILLILLSIYK